MTAYDEANSRYLALLAELEAANARTAAEPDNAELAAAAQLAYDQAQAAYADVIAAHDEAQVEQAAHGDADSTADSRALEPGAVPDDAMVESVDAPGAAPLLTDYDLGDFGVPAASPAPEFGDQAPEGVFVLTRKPAATRFVPSETPIDELTPISRSLLPRRANDRRSELSRERNIAGDLPDWAPLPPGEVLAVKRTGIAP